MDMKVVTKTYHAIVYHDTGAGEFVVCLKGDTKGGPVISSNDEGEAMAKFKEALSLSCACSNLLAFSEATKADKAERAQIIGKFCGKHEIEYSHVSA